MGKKEKTLKFKKYQTRKYFGVKYKQKDKRNNNFGRFRARGRSLINKSYTDRYGTDDMEIVYPNLRIQRMGGRGWSYSNPIGHKLTKTIQHPKQPKETPTPPIIPFKIKVSQEMAKVYAKDPSSLFYDNIFAETIKWLWGLNQYVYDITQVATEDKLYKFFAKGHEKGETDMTPSFQYIICPTKKSRWYRRYTNQKCAYYDIYLTYATDGVAEPLHVYRLYICRRDGYSTWNIYYSTPSNVIYLLSNKEFNLIKRREEDSHHLMKQVDDSDMKFLQYGKSKSVSKGTHNDDNDFMDYDVAKMLLRKPIYDLSSARKELPLQDMYEYLRRKEEKEKREKYLVEMNKKREREKELKAKKEAGDSAKDGEEKLSFLQAFLKKLDDKSVKSKDKKK